MAKAQFAPKPQFPTGKIWRQLGEVDDPYGYQPTQVEE